MSSWMMRFCCAHSNNLNWDPIQNQASGRNMESYLSFCFLTLAVFLPLGLEPEKKGQGITSLNGPCLHQIYIEHCDQMGFVWLDQKRSANTVKIIPMQECWWKTPNKHLALSLSLSVSCLQHPATPLQASCFDSHSIFRWHWTEKIIFLLPLGSCSRTDMENYFRGRLNHKRYFCFHFYSLSLPLCHSFFTVSLSNSFTLSGEDLPEALRECSV